MEEKLIEQLRIHSQQRIENNKQTVWANIRPDILHRISYLEPRRIASHYFFAEDSPIFMSLHDENGNDNNHYHDFFEMNYVLSGNPITVVDGHEIILEPGQLVLMNPKAVHHFKRCKDGSDYILNIGFPVDTFQKHVFLPFLNDPVLNAFFTRYRIENSQHPSFIYLRSLDDRVENLIELLTNEYLTPKSYNKVVIESLITLLFSFILRSFDSQLQEESNPISQVLDYMYQHYQHCTIETLASQFNYHPKYLSALIRKHTDQTYRELLTKIKLQNSQHYLLYTDYPIEQIVDLIGYKEKSSFYAGFRKQFHISPGDYRKSHANFR